MYRRGETFRHGAGPSWGCAGGEGHSGGGGMPALHHDALVPTFEVDAERLALGLISPWPCAEPPLPRRIRRQCRGEMLPAEIRPQHVQENQLGIRPLPQQEIRQPLLA